MAFGLALAVWLASAPFSAPSQAFGDTPAAIGLSYTSAVHWLAQQEDLVNRIRLATIALALLFATGVVPVVTYALTAIGTLVWLFAETVSMGPHPYAVIVLPSIALAIVPWHHSPPLHRLWGAAAGGPHRRYGFAPWFLCLAMGVALDAAAWSKLREGFLWITSGSVKYAWVSDADHAMVDWGLTLASMPRVSVAFSAGAVFIEAAVILAAFVRGRAFRLVIGAAALSLLSGFALLQGVFWPAWWILLLGFMPWEAIDASSSEDVRTLTPAHAWWGAVIIAQQLAVSTAFIEFDPIASRYDMYSKARVSTALFDQERSSDNTTRRLAAMAADGSHVDITGCATDIAGANVAQLLKSEPGARHEPIPALLACTDRPTTEFRLVEDSRVFDWNAGRFVWLYREKLVASLAPR
jgi:hypothetical protein